MLGKIGEKLIEFISNLREKNLALFFFSIYSIIIIIGILIFVFYASIYSMSLNSTSLSGSIVFAFISYAVLIGGWVISGFSEGSRIDQHFNKINKALKENAPPSLYMVNGLLPAMLVLMFIFLFILNPLLLIISYMLYTVIDGFLHYEISLIYKNSKSTIDDVLLDLIKSSKTTESISAKLNDYFTGNYKLYLVIMRLIIIGVSLFFYNNSDILYIAFSISILINELYFSY